MIHTAEMMKTAWDQRTFSRQPASGACFDVSDPAASNDPWWREVRGYPPGPEPQLSPPQAPAPKPAPPGAGLALSEIDDLFARHPFWPLSPPYRSARPMLPRLQQPPVAARRQLRPLPVV